MKMGVSLQPKKTFMQAIVTSAKVTIAEDIKIFNSQWITD